MYTVEPPVITVRRCNKVGGRALTGFLVEWTSTLVRRYEPPDSRVSPVRVVPLPSTSDSISLRTVAGIVRGNARISYALCEPLM